MRASAPYFSILLFTFTQDVDVDEISATLIGEDTSRLKFVAKGMKLMSGQNLLNLSCAVSVRVRSVSFFLNDNLSVRLQPMAHTYSRAPKSRYPTCAFSGITRMLQVAELSANVRGWFTFLVTPKPSMSNFVSPKRVSKTHQSKFTPWSPRVFVAALGTSSQIQLVVFPGRNDILTANIRLSAPAGIIFDFIKATLHPEGECLNLFH